MFKPASQIRKNYVIANSTLRKWAAAGKISSRTMPGGKHIYKEADIQFLLGDQVEDQREKIIYARVSSHHQKEDLKRQCMDLEREYPGYRVITDIASALNYERKGLQTLLEAVFKGSVGTVVVAHKDRLVRFGFELFETIFRRFEVRLVVHCGNFTSTESELAQDLLAVTNFFVARNNGRRSAINRRKRKHKDEESKATADESAI